MSENGKLHNKIDDINIILFEDIFKHRKNIGLIQKNNINSIADNKLTNNSEYEEDNYHIWVYDKPISEDLITFNEQDDKLSSKSLDSIKHKLTKNSINFIENATYDRLNEHIEKKANLNFSFEYKTKNNAQLNIYHNIAINDDENYFNYLKNITIFNSLHKKIFKKPNIINNKFTIENNNVSSKNCKFSKKNRKKELKKKTEKKKIYIHNQNTSEIYIDLKDSNNKYITLENILENTDNNSKISYNKTMTKKANFKKYDAYIMSSDFESNLSEREKEDLFKGNNIFGGSVRKLDISIDNNIFDENTNINKTKIKNHSINYSNTNINPNNKSIKEILNNYKIKENNIILNTKSKKKDSLDKHKIITKRIILEEEFIVSPQGDKKLLSIKRYDKEKEKDINENESLNDNVANYGDTHYFQKNFKKGKNIRMHNNHKNTPSIDYRNSLNNSLFSSIFKDNSRQTEYNRTYLKSIEEDSQIISNINYYNNNYNNKHNNTSHLNDINVEIPSNIIYNNPHIRNRNNKIDKEKEKSHAQKINSELTNKEMHLKKKLFYNKIYYMKDRNNNINKFDENNNNSNKTENNNISNISSHANFLNSNRTSMNYIQDNQKYKLDPNKSIYERISFNKEQPCTIYHNEIPNNSFVINNNQNCPNLVNIVFVNNKERNKMNINNRSKYLNKNKNDIPQPQSKRPKLSCRLKRSNHRFHEIKSMSIGNFSNLKSTRNYHRSESNKFMNINYNNSSYELNNINDKLNIYSSTDDLNNDKMNENGSNNYYEISNYDSSRNQIIKKNEGKTNINISNRGISEYFAKYIN